MEDELFSDIKIYLGDEVSEEDNSLIKLLIKLAINNVCTYRNYPRAYSDEMKDEDMKIHYGIIFSAVLGAWNKQGMEAEKSHSERGFSTTLINDAELYSGVIPIARVL